MNGAKPGKGPWTHRLLILFFAGLFGLLVFWLIGFVLRDIGNWPGPDYLALERQMLDEQLVVQSDAIEKETAATGRSIAEQKERQQILRESTAASQQTMNQLLEFQRLNLQQGADLTDDERQALAESEKLFLDNQRQYQQLNQDVAELSTRLRELQEDRRELETQIERERDPIRQRYEQLRERHDLKVAVVKLAVLLPLALVALFLFLKWRRSLYAPLINAVGAAVLVRIGLVMHEYFPTRYFKYVLILVSLAVVAWILIHLLRAVAFPKRDWLLKRYREAYERFACPVCDYPIRRGPLRFLTRRRRLETPIVSADMPDEPYVCPSCGTRLFEECEVCHATRHALLPACEKCGAEKPVTASGTERDHPEDSPFGLVPGGDSSSSE